MKVKLNGKEFDVPQNAMLKDLLPYEDSLVVIVRGKKDHEKRADTFKFQIGKGSLTLKIENQELWKAIEDKIQELEIAWRTKRVIAFGPFSCNLKCSTISHEYEPGEVILSFAGGSMESAFLMFAVTRYPLTHCSSADGVVARVIEGFEVLRSLEIGEKIEKIEPVFGRGDLGGVKVRASLDEKLLEGDEIYSQVILNLKKDNPSASEYAMTVLEKNRNVEELTKTFIRFNGIKGLKIGEENPEKRIRGAVTIRRNGKNAGDIYFYLKDRMPHRDHSVVGFVESGVELLEVAQKGDKIKIVTNPSRIDLIGLTQAEAEAFLAKNGLKQIREGEAQDEDIVISQIPETTFEAFSRGEVITVGVKPSKIVKLKIFDELAPKTALYFRIATSLVGKRIGKLPVYFKTKDLVVFKTTVSFEEPLIPENTPKNLVSAGDIGVTNMSRKHAGLIGVRFTDSKDFGPTAERFESTNIVGKVVENFEVIKEAKEGSEIYIMEVQE
ncbi:MAG: methanogenesis marker 3 protein [Archaeoglobaceae archaeon]|nr:methanogenesis marker 3 protein [Archaeoglobaceae archaeon]MDW8118435.1 methanogenesis marker 3 protein [Archaeoglobaceae archaeon]